MFNIKNWLKPDVSHLEDGGMPFTEWVLTLNGTSFNVTQIGQGGTTWTNDDEAERIKIHLEARGLIVNALMNLVPPDEKVEEEPINAPIKIDPVKDGLDACGFPPTKGGK